MHLILINIFDSFNLTSKDAFESIGTRLMDTNSYPSEETKKALIGLARDLRGLACASITRSAYMMFFDWM